MISTGKILEQRMADELEIRNLLNRMAHLADGSDVDEYVACFTEDALWETPNDSLRGRDAIRASAYERRRAGMQGPGSDSCHVVTNQVVSFDGPDGASSQSYMLYVVSTRSNPEIRAMARYRDTLSRTSEGWRLAERRITFGDQTASAL